MGLWGLHRKLSFPGSHDSVSTQITQQIQVIGSLLLFMSTEFVIRSYGFTINAHIYVFFPTILENFFLDLPPHFKVMIKMLAPAVLWVQTRNS